VNIVVLNSTTKDEGHTLIIRKGFVVVSYQEIKVSYIQVIGNREVRINIQAYSDYVVTSQNFPNFGMLKEINKSE
jgi:hypothetical protein